VVYDEGVPWFMTRKEYRGCLPAMCTVQHIVEKRRKEYCGCLPYALFSTMWKKRRKPNLPTFLLFVNYGKACGNVNQGNT
jgi:hypothetical protein